MAIPIHPTRARPAWSRAASLRRHLRAGGLIAYATRACFGLGCDPRNVRALRALIRAKGRPARKGLITIAADWRHLRPLAAPPDPASLALAQSTWPGPHTWLFPAAVRAPALLRGRSRDVALRVDAHPDAVALCRATGMALVSTSANRSGRRPIKDTRTCLRAFGRSAIVVPGRIERHTRPSTIRHIHSGRVLRA